MLKQWESESTQCVSFCQTLDQSDGGPARNAFELSNRLCALNGTRDRLFYFTGDSPLTPDSAGTSSLQVQRLGMQGRLAQLRTMYSSVSTASAVIVHGFYLLWVPVVLLICAITRTPVFLCPHGSLGRYQEQKSRFRKHCFRLIAYPLIRFSRVTFIVASKREAQETAVAVPKVQTRVIGLAVEIPIRFDSEREEWNAPLNLLCACRLAAKKRLDLCIEAVAVLRRRSIPATLHIYGSGEPAFLNSLIELAEACGVADYVTFHGEKGSYEVYDAMSRADFFLLPSDDENFAIAAAEALTAGLPIIVSDRVDAATDLPRSCGTVLREPSPTTIAAAVEEFAMSMDRYRTRDACTQEARFRYSWQGALTAWQSIIRST